MKVMVTITVNFVLLKNQQYGSWPFEFPVGKLRQYYSLLNVKYLRMGKLDGMTFIIYINCSESLVRHKNLFKTRLTEPFLPPCCCFQLERAPSPDHRRRGYRDLDKPRRSPVVRYRRSRSRSPRR